MSTIDRSSTIKLQSCLYYIQLTHCYIFRCDLYSGATYNTLRKILLWPIFRSDLYSEATYTRRNTVFRLCKKNLLIKACLPKASSTNFYFILQILNPRVLKLMEYRFFSLHFFYLNKPCWQPCFMRSKLFSQLTWFQSGTKGYWTTSICTGIKPPLQLLGS